MFTTGQSNTDKIYIREVFSDIDLEESLRTIKASFATVVKDFNLTEKDNSSNPAFTNITKLKEMKANGVKMYGLYVGSKQKGFVAIEKANDEVFYMERLAVHPDSRHKGYGRNLIDFVIEHAKQNGGKKVSIGIINENERLKNWYRKHGFEETGLKKFEHMSFTVCFMEKFLL